MKRLFLPILGLFIFFGSCDVIDGPVNEDFVIDPSEGSSFDKAVLLIDFTGHKCGNCPTAGETAKMIESSFGDKVVIIAAHVGTLAFPQPIQSGKYYVDFRTETGDVIDQEFGASISGIPNGLVNYEKLNGQTIIKPDAWAGFLSDQLAVEEVPFGIEATLNLNGSESELSATVKFGEDVTGNYSLGAFLIEDSIVSWQKDYTKNPQDIENYVQSHVLRGNYYRSGNPQVLAWGLPLNSTSYSSGDEETMDLVFNLDPEYRSQHCSAVVFLYDLSNKVILQVRKFDL